MSHLKEGKRPGNNYLRMPCKRREVWAVPSCWNQISASSWSPRNWFNCGRRKVSILGQYRSEVTVTR
ncbi:hypothetical protein TNCV_1107101 [Trichonephila clavipes]|nr:hypothetical protein TNCV_1107101 [Trichonephila clavipes]